MTNRRLALLAALAVSAVVVAVLAASEIFLRVTVARPLRSPQPQVRYDPHPVRRFTLRPSQEGFTFEAPFRVDAAGLRVNGPSMRAEARHSIVGLGDSFTFGMGVRDEETWPSRLEHYLDAAGESIVVRNAGTISYDAFHELDLLRDLLGARTITPPPSIVVHALYWNDYLTHRPPERTDPSVLTPEGYFVWNEASQPPSRLRALANAAIDRSMLAFVASRAVAWARDQLTGGTAAEGLYSRVERELEAGYVDTAGFASVRAVYHRMVALGDSAGFRTFVVIMPVLGVVAHKDATQQPYPQFIRSMLTELEIPFLDVHELFERGELGTADYLPFNRHVGARGYDVIARSLAPRLILMLAQSAAADGRSARARAGRGGAVPDR